MADTKISALTAATTPLAGTEVLPIVQSSTTKKVAVSDLTAGRSVSAASLSLTTTPLAVTSGGTGLATVAQGDLLYGSASNTLSVLAKNTTATRYLANTGTSNNPAWAQVDLTNGVTGTLPTGNGGTGLTSFTANALVSSSSTSALTTANSLYTDNAGRLALGTNNLSGQAFRVSITSFAAVPSGFYCNDGDGNAEQFGITRQDATNGRGIRFQTTLDGSNLPYYTISTGTAASTIAGMTWTQRFRVDTSDVTVSTGNLVIGTSGKGIDFSATPGTGTSELFADYEEGTFTPNIGGTATYTNQVGRYTKVGRLVTCFIRLTINQRNTGSDNTISGLPFTSVNSGEAQGGLVNYFGSIAVNSIYVAAYVANNSTTMQFTNTTAATATMTPAAALIGSAADFAIAITYETA